MLLPISFVAIVLTGLALVAPAAHLFELFNKIGMPENEYFIVQKVYNGWWIVGFFLPAAFVANLALAYAARDDRTTCWLAVLAAALIAANLAIFFLWTQPANSATSNWTFRPENWHSLRQQWEYSHAVNAAVVLVAFCAATIASLRARS